MIGAITEFEGDLIQERTEEGRHKAQAAGVKFGRKIKLQDDELAQLRKDAAVPRVTQQPPAKAGGLVLWTGKSGYGSKDPFSLQF